MLTREELRAALVEAGFGRIAQRISLLCEPSVLVRTHANPYGAMAVGSSRIGGLPDLPVGMNWPTWRGNPLAFLAQFDLADLNGFACGRVLPSAGHLWFFYDLEQRTWGFDPQDRGSWNVMYANTVRSDLRTCEGPGLPAHAVYRPCNLTFHDFLSIPGPDHLSVAPLHLTVEEIEELDEIECDLHEMIESSADGQFEPHHQLLGHPKQIQGEMQLECQFASNGHYCGNATGYEEPARRLLEPGAQDWRLLFQLDTDDGAQSGKPGMMWGDCGRLYFWIRHQDLAKRAFENAWMILQCS